MPGNMVEKLKTLPFMVLSGFIEAERDVFPSWRCHTMAVRGMAATRDGGNHAPGTLIRSDRFWCRSWHRSLRR